MATTSEIKTGLDAITRIMSEQRVVMRAVKSNAAGVSAELANIPTAYADVIATVQAFAAGTTNAFELNAKAELAALTTEFQALKAKADTVAATDLSNGV